MNPGEIPLCNPLRLSPPRELETTEEVTGEDKRRMKRDREAAYGPTTPRGESGEESKVLGGLTPLAKKGRVQPDVAGTVSDDSKALSDTESLEPMDKVEGSSLRKTITPPRAPGLESASAPPTPILSSNKPLAFKREGLETMDIRHRVEALEWEDGRAPARYEPEVTENAEMAPVGTVDTEVSEEVKDVELKDAASAAIESEGSKDIEIGTKDEILGEPIETNKEAAEPMATTIEEDSDSRLPTDISEPVTVIEKDVEFAEVAAEVGASAEVVHRAEDQKEAESKEVAEVAAEVGESAKLVAAEDEKEAEVTAVEAESKESVEPTKQPQVHEEVASYEPETEASPEDGERIPAPPVALPATPAKNVRELQKNSTPVATDNLSLFVNSQSFSAFSSTASPFSAFKSAASPFAAVVEPPVPAQRPKAKSTFGSLLPGSTAPSTPIATSSKLPPRSSILTPSTLSSLPSSFGTPILAAPVGVRPPPPTPATPFAKTLAPKSSLGPTASPFSAFASSSGFAAAGTTSSSSAFGSYSASVASPFASIQAEATLSDDQSGSNSRKLGEPVEVDAGKRVFTEQELFTGEEDDNTIHTVRSKLFVMIAGAWVERGTGILRLNVTKDTAKAGARLVMRADATHRLLLNATLFPEFSIEVSQEKYVRFAVIEDSEPISYMLRMAGAPAAQSLVTVLQEQVDRL